MDLIETGAVAQAVLPVAGLRAHLRMGSGFSDDTTQDDMLAAYLRAAIATIEARTGKALLRRGFELRLRAWAASERQPLPCAPIATIDEISLIGRDGAAMVVDAARWRLVADMHRPLLVPVGAVLPVIPWGGGVRIRFEAGFGAEWGDLPTDLAQAVMLLAARHYEDRDAGAAPGALPQAVAALCARWRAVRIGGGI